MGSCRKCCQTPAYNIEVTMVEFIPLAFHLFEAGEADEWLTRLSNIGDDEPCVLLERDCTRLPAGGCRYYQLRPMICRLFGFSAAIMRNGLLSPVLCRLAKRSLLFGDNDQPISHTETTLPVLADYARKIFSLDPYLSGRQYPINIALKKALEYVGFKLYLCKISEALQDSTSSSSEHQCP